MELAEQLGDSSTTARALDVIGTVEMYPDPAGARPGLERARELALASGDEWCFVDATQVVAMTLIMQADAAAIDVLNEALEIIERTGYAEFSAWHWFGVGWVRHFQGRDDEALALYERAIEVADAVGEPVSAGMTHAFLAMLRSDRGDGAAALSKLGPVIDASIAAGAGLAIPPLRAAMSYVAACAGDVETARISAAQRVEAALGTHGPGEGNALPAGPSGAYGQAVGLSMLARIELAAEDPTAAADHARLACEIADRALGNQLIGAAARRCLAMAALAHDDVSDAERLAHEALAIAIDHRFAADIFPALDLLARAAAALESHEEAARILGAADRAREELGRVRWRHEQSAIDDLRERLRLALGDDQLATEIDAGRALSTSDAVAWLRRARGSRKRATGGWESLTPTERQVVELATDGLTNPEIGQRMFISRGTVKIHLSHIYAKLGVRNRSELASRAARRTNAARQKGVLS
jgi:DNA-binding CsgD family transcriptional regulator